MGRLPIGATIIRTGTELRLKFRQGGQVGSGRCTPRWIEASSGMECFADRSRVRGVIGLEWPVTAGAAARITKELGRHAYPSIRDGHRVGTVGRVSRLRKAGKRQARRMNTSETREKRAIS